MSQEHSKSNQKSPSGSKKMRWLWVVYLVIVHIIALVGLMLIYDYNSQNIGIGSKQATKLAKGIAELQCVSRGNSQDVCSNLTVSDPEQEEIPDKTSGTGKTELFYVFKVSNGSYADRIFIGAKGTYTLPKVNNSKESSN